LTWKHDSEAAAGLAGPGRLDRRVEREEIGLPGNRLDQLDHVANLLRRIGKAGKFDICRINLL